MTSHYVRCFVKGSFENVFEVLNRAFGNVYAKNLMIAMSFPEESF